MKKKKKKKRGIKRKLEQPTLPQNKPNKENERKGEKVLSMIIQSE
jgi:hypothetical protein